MPIHIAMRISYPERGNYNWYNALAAYQAIGAVEVAFYRPELSRPLPATGSLLKANRYG